MASRAKSHEHGRRRHCRARLAAIVFGFSAGLLRSLAILGYLIAAPRRIGSTG